MEPFTVPDGMVGPETDYRAGAFTEYSDVELGMWIHLFSKRAGHRANPDKRIKDLTDAFNYAECLFNRTKDALAKG